MDNTPDRIEAPGTRAGDGADSARAWAAPKLTVLGALDSHTAGSTIQLADSVNAGIFGGDSGVIS
jgi:hypothetical protein